MKQRMRIRTKTKANTAPVVAAASHPRRASVPKQGGFASLSPPAGACPHPGCFDTRCHRATFTRDEKAWMEAL